MKWTIKEHEEYSKWFEELKEDAQDSIFESLLLLEREGSHLGRPHVDTLKGSRFPNMKELRVQHRGEPWRIIFMFDPKREGILLLGGNKKGNDNWYKKNIPIAEQRYEEHLKKLKTKEKGHDDSRKKNEGTAKKKKGKNRKKGG